MVHYSPRPIFSPFNIGSITVYLVLAQPKWKKDGQVFMGVSSNKNYPYSWNRGGIGGFH